MVKSTNGKTYNPSTDKILSAIVRQIITIAHPDKIILFGSRVSGKQTKDSDYDICVLKKNLKQRRKLAQKIYLKMDIMAPVDVIVNTPERYETLRHKWFFIYYDIDKYGKVLYEKH